MGIHKFDMERNKVLRDGESMSFKDVVSYKDYEASRVKIGWWARNRYDIIMVFCVVIPEMVTIRDNVGMPCLIAGVLTSFYIRWFKIMRWKYKTPFKQFIFFLITLLIFELVVCNAWQFLFGTRVSDTLWLYFLSLKH